MINSINVLVELASLQTLFLTLDEATEATNRKVNALENMVNPRLENTIRYIKWELHELEREDFFRIKNIQSYKKRELERQMQSAKNFGDKQDLETFALQKGMCTICCPWRLKMSGGIRLSKEGCVFLEFAPAVGTRQYDWSKKQIFALSVLELGTLLSFDPNEPCEFFHDPFVGKTEAGNIRKVLKVGMLQDTGGYFFNLRVSDRILNIDESLFMPITKGEFSVMQSAFNFILPYLMGWHAYLDSTKPFESGQFTSGSPSIGKRPDLEWGR